MSDTTGGAPSPNPPAPAGTATNHPDDMVDVEGGRVREPTRYERSLRGRVAAAEAAAAEAQRLRDESVRAAQAERDRAVADAAAAANARVIRAELKALAAKAGILDPGDLAHVDVSAVKLTETGDVEGAAAFIEALKTSKPHWFADHGTGAQTGTTTATTKTPPPAAGGPKHARDMSDVEYKSTLANLTARRR